MAITEKLIIAFFVSNNGAPAVNLTPTIRIWEVTATTNTLVVGTGSPGPFMTSIGDGFYKYNFTGYDSTIKFAIRIDGGDNNLSGGRYAASINDSFADDTAFAAWQEQTKEHPIGSPQTFGSLTQETAQNTVNILDYSELLIAAQYNRTFLNKTTATLTIYASDKTTPLRVFSLRDSGGAPSITEIVDRVPVGGSPLVIPPPSP